MSRGLHELFHLKEHGAHRLMRVIKWISLLVVCGISFWLLLDGIDRFNGSSPGFAMSQMSKEMTGRREPQEKEALALLNYAVGQTDLTRLRALRVGLANELSNAGAQARFNRTSFRMSLDTSLLHQSAWEQRWASFHEIGHAVAFVTLRDAPYPIANWGLSADAAKTMRDSLLYQQVYSESFADLFSLSMTLRLNPQDPVALERLRNAKNKKLELLSMGHDTSAGLRLAENNIHPLTTLKGRPLLGFIDALASEGALRGVSSWGAEREAMCSEGLWGWVSWMKTEGQMIVTIPWQLASEAPPDPESSDPKDKVLLELMQFRGSEGVYKRELAEQERDAYEKAKALIISSENSKRTAGIAMSGFVDSVKPASSWGEVLAQEEWKAYSPSRQALEPVVRKMAIWLASDTVSGCQHHE